MPLSFASIRRFVVLKTVANTIFSNPLRDRTFRVYPVIKPTRIDPLGKSSRPTRSHFASSTVPVMMLQYVVGFGNDWPKRSWNATDLRLEHCCVIFSLPVP
jgi:hypothetical protein